MEFANGSNRGSRRLRVSECWATLRAEGVYAELLRAGTVLRPGDRAKLELLVPIETDDRCSTPWYVTAESLANPLWLKGRLFLRCLRCDGRCSRLYVPRPSLQPRCRRCWGLSYQSQTWNYKGSEWDRLPCYVTTDNARQDRRRDARSRYAARRRSAITTPPMPTRRSRRA